MYRIPLAERMRPKKLRDVIGQAHLLGEGEILQHIVKNKQPVSLILWGPPGSGKTTLARIIANEVNADFVELSAVIAGKKDVMQVIEKAKASWCQKSNSATLFDNKATKEKNTPKRTVLFVDEIHRFNKAQQDAFLPHVESGLITLIGATTENPSFEVINPLLSRARVLILQPLTKKEIIKILKKAIKQEKIATKVSDKALDYIAELSDGDARIALGNLDLALGMADKVTPEVVKLVAQKKVPSYDKTGDTHHNVISAFIKSMRGSDVDATLYYLARMIEAGEDPKFIARRMVVFASEDIGLAGNGALTLAVSAFQAVERIGMPESSNVLFHVATALAKSEKSRRTNEAMHRAFEVAQKFPNSAVPLHLRNTPTKVVEDISYGKDYKMKADFKHDKGFLPEEINDKKIY